jgi:hypothetical protein
MPQQLKSFVIEALVENNIGVTQLGPNWVIPTAIYGVFWPITRHIWGSLPANCVSPIIIRSETS